MAIFWQLEKVMFKIRIIQKLCQYAIVTVFIASGSPVSAAPVSAPPSPSGSSALMQIFEHNDLSDTDFSASALGIKFHGFQKDEVSEVLPDSVPDFALSSGFSYTAIWGGYGAYRGGISLTMILKSCLDIASWPFEVKWSEVTDAAGSVEYIKPRTENSISLEIFDSYATGLCSVTMSQHRDGKFSLSPRPVADSAQSRRLAQEIGLLAGLVNLRNAGRVANILQTTFSADFHTKMKEELLEDGALYTLQPSPLIDSARFRYAVWKPAQIQPGPSAPQPSRRLVELSFEIDRGQVCGRLEDVLDVLGAAGINPSTETNERVVATGSGPLPITLTVTSQDGCMKIVGLQQEAAAMPARNTLP